MKRTAVSKKGKKTKSKFSSGNYKNNKELNIDDKAIIKFLKIVARRKFFQSYLNNMAKSMCIGIFIAFILNLLSLFIPIYNADIYGFYIIAASFIISLLYSLIKYPSLYDAAMYADAAGLKEKMVTSLEFMGMRGGFSELLKEDTLSEIEAFDKKFRLPIRYPWKEYVVAGLFLSMFAVCVFLPAQSKLDAEKLHNLAMEADEVKEKVKEADKALNKAMKDEETKAEAEKVKEILKQAKKELGEAKTSHDIKKAEERLAKKLKEELAKAAGENNVSESGSSKKLIEAMQPLVPELDLAQFAEYNEKLSELAQTSGLGENALNELKGLGEMLTKEQMEKLLENLEKSMADGKISDGELKKALESTDSADAQMASASITQMQEASAGSQGEASQQSGTSGGAQEGESSQSSGTSGGAQAGVQSSSGGQSENQNNVSGSGGSGSGEGNSGSGAGNGGAGNGSNGGSGNGQGGMGGSWNMGSDKGLERKPSGGEAESVFVTGMEVGNDDNLTGKKSGDAKITEKGNQSGDAMAGSKANLDSVVGDYSSQAYAKINSGQVPAAMKDVVKNYFSGLNN